jgi:hypothetical protein
MGKEEICPLTEGINCLAAKRKAKTYCKNELN